MDTNELIEVLREHAKECFGVAKWRAEVDTAGLHEVNTVDWAYGTAFEHAANQLEQYQTALKDISFMPWRSDKPYDIFDASNRARDVLGGGPNG